MALSDASIVVIGAGAAGIAAARRLRDAGTDVVLIEARGRAGGRAFTETVAGFPIDLGCGWLHSAETNPWVAIAQAQGRTIDRTPAPWLRPSMIAGFPLAEQEAFRNALEAFHDRVDLAPGEADRPLSAFVEPGGRWNALIDAISTYVSGAELDKVSARDLIAYHDSGVNWRIVEGYGALIAAHADGVRTAFGCVATRIDHGGRRLRIETSQGTIAADAAIVTVPTSLLAAEAIAFSPALPDKIEAAAALPLGVDDKLFLSLDGAEEFEKDSRLFGATDSAATGIYHFRPFGRPMIECYYGGSHAAALETGGEAAFFDFARSELTSRLGSAFARRIAPIRVHPWRADPFARGAYSYAAPGKADCRATLAAPVDGRLFFAGEACSTHDFSTAHGAYLTGLDAAGQAMKALAARARRRTD